jgi:hypothetical protein
LGENDSSGNDGVMRQSDGQKLANDIINAVQQAINQGFLRTQPGTGFPAPTIQQVQAEASDITFSA